MDNNNEWIYFYSWKKIFEVEVVMMTNTATPSTTQHSWIAMDGSKVETSTTFPPFKGIMLGEAQSFAKAIPLVIKYDNALGIDGRIKKASEQLKWTNTAIKGLDINVAKAVKVKDYFDSLTASVSDVNNSLNNIQFVTSSMRSYSRKSLEKVEALEAKVEREFHSTQESIEKLFV